MLCARIEYIAPVLVGANFQPERSCDGADEMTIACN